MKPSEHFLAALLYKHATLNDDVGDAIGGAANAVGGMYDWLGELGADKDPVTGVKGKNWFGRAISDSDSAEAKYLNYIPFTGSAIQAGQGMTKVWDTGGREGWGDTAMGVGCLGLDAASMLTGGGGFLASGLKGFATAGLKDVGARVGLEAGMGALFGSNPEMGIAGQVGGNLHNRLFGGGQQGGMPQQMAGYGGGYQGGGQAYGSAGGATGWQPGTSQSPLTGVPSMTAGTELPGGPSNQTLYTPPGNATASAWQHNGGVKAPGAMGQSPNILGGAPLGTTPSVNKQTLKPPSTTGNSTTAMV